LALASLPADAIARGKAFQAALRPASLGSLALSVGITVGLGLTHAGAALVTAVSRPVGSGWVVQALLGGFALLAVTELVTVPLAVWREQVLRAFGLSQQTWRSWLIDVIKGYVVGGILAAVVLVSFFGLGRLAPRTWWIFAAAGAAGLVVVFSFVFPVVIEPLFHRFRPMEAGEQRDGLLALAERDRVRVRDVLVADASRRTTALNAYVSGLGPTRRIVVYDTLLAVPEQEVRCVVAHELGHVRDGDLLTATVTGALGTAAAACAVYLIGGYQPLLRLAGTPALTDPRSIALLAALAAVGGLLAAPLQAAISRRVEARADAHALALTNDPVTVEAMERRLALTNLADADPPRWEHVWFASHPSVVQRMAAARAYARGER
jgi:STE24 endopeptidase